MPGRTTRGKGGKGREVAQEEPCVAGRKQHACPAKGGESQPRAKPLSRQHVSCLKNVFTKWRGEGRRKGHFCPSQSSKDIHPVLSCFNIVVQSVPCLVLVYPVMSFTKPCPVRQSVFSCKICPVLFTTTTMSQKLEKDTWHKNNSPHKTY